MSSDFSQPSREVSHHVPTRVLAIILTTVFVVWYASTISDDIVACITAGISLITVLLWLVRRGEALDGLHRKRRMHLIAGLLLMPVSALTGPWAGLMGSFVLLHGFLSRQQDGDRNCSLAYLTLVPIICIRPPFGLADRIRSRIGAEAVRITGLLLDEAGVLHDRSRTAITSAAGTFEVGDVVSDFTDVPVLLALAAVLLCVWRRRLLHVVPALVIAGGFWFVMVVGGLLAYATVPQASEMPEWMLRSLCFAITIVLFALAEYGLAVLTEAIPTVARSVAKGHGMVNPFVVIWNRLTLALTPEDLLKHRELPSLHVAIAVGRGKLGRRLRWPVDFLGAWLASRRWRWATLNAPLIVFVSLGVYISLKKPANQAHRYQSAMERAIQEGRASASDFILNRMKTEGIVDLPFLHTFAMQVISEGHPEIAEPFIRRLTPPDRSGYLPTRIWLVQTSRTPNTVFSMNLTERIEHLNTGLRFYPDDVDLLQLLAAEYINIGQLSLAESLLQRAAVHEPAAAGVLLRLMSQLQRDPEDIARLANRYMHRLEQRLQQASSDEADKVVGRVVALAGIYAEKNRIEDAEELLTRHPRALEYAQVRGSLSTLLTTRARNLLTVGGANLVAQDLLIRAVELDSANLAATQQLYRVSRRLGPVSSPIIARAIDQLTSELSPKPGSGGTHQGLINLLAASGRQEEAVVLLQSVHDRSPAITVMLVQLLHSSGQTEAAQELLTQLRDELIEPADNGTDPLSSDSIELVARAYAAIQRYRDAVEFIDTHAQSEHEHWPVNLRNLYVESLVLASDRNASDSSSDTTDKYSVLERALTINPSSEWLLQQMIEVSYQDSKSAAAAKSYLLKRLADPNRVHGTRKAMSVAALLHEDYDEALKLLRRCVERETDDPAILNNLAVACIRCSTENGLEALKWIELALDRAPHHPEFRATRAEILIALQRWDEAQDDVDAVLGVDPNHAEALAMRMTIRLNAQASPEG